MIAPTVIVVSARLNMLNQDTPNQSTTLPRRILSIAFPAAPPAIHAMPIFVRFFQECQKVKMMQINIMAIRVYI